MALPRHEPTSPRTQGTLADGQRPEVFHINLDAIVLKQDEATNLRFLHSRRWKARSKSESTGAASTSKSDSITWRAER